MCEVTFDVTFLAWTTIIPTAAILLGIVGLFMGLRREVRKINAQPKVES
jgi:hypothetical protein